MNKLISLILAALLALSTLTAAFAATCESNKDVVRGVQYTLNKSGYVISKTASFLLGWKQMTPLP